MQLRLLDHRDSTAKVEFLTDDSELRQALNHTFGAFQYASSVLSSAELCRCSHTGNVRGGHGKLYDIIPAKITGPSQVS